MHEFSSAAPEIAVREEQGTEIIGEQNGGHGELFAGRVDGAAFAEEVVCYFFRGEDDLRAAGDVEGVHWTVGLGPGEELEPGVVGWDGEEGAEEGEACCLCESGIGTE